MVEFRLFENKSHCNIEINTTLEIEEVLLLKGDCALLLSEWFYRVKSGHLKDKTGEYDYFIKCYGEDLLDIILALELVLSEDTDKDLLCLYYFPPSYSKTYKSKEIFTEEYYANLNEVKNLLEEIIPSNTLFNRERVFYYNISW